MLLYIAVCPTMSWLATKKGKRSKILGTNNAPYSRSEFDFIENRPISLAARTIFADLNRINVNSFFQLG